MIYEMLLRNMLRPLGRVPTRASISMRESVVHRAYSASSLSGHALGSSWFTDANSQPSVGLDTHQNFGKEKMELPSSPLKAIFVGNLPLTFTETELQQVADSRFIKKEHLRKVRIARMHSNGKGRGFGFLEFYTEKQARDAMVCFFHGLTIDGREIKFDLDVGEDGVKGGRRSGLTNPQFSLFVGNVPYRVDDDTMVTHIVELMRAKHATSHILRQNRNRLEHAKQQQQQQNQNAPHTDYVEEPLPEFIIPIINCKMPGTGIGTTHSKKNNSIGPKGYCLVEFASAESMRAALAAIEFSELNGRPLNVCISDKFMGGNVERGRAMHGRDFTNDYSRNEDFARGKDTHRRGGEARRERDRRKGKELGFGEDADADTGKGSTHKDSYGDSESEDSRESRNALQNKRFERPKYSLYVGNVSWKASLEEVVGQIEQVIDKNTIKKIRWSHDKHTGDFRGFGHIDFYSERDAVDSVPALSLLTIRERKLNVNVAIRKFDFDKGNDY